MKIPISVTVNGRLYARDVEPRLLLVHFIRDGATRRRVGQIMHLSRGAGRRR